MTRYGIMVRGSTENDKEDLESHESRSNLDVGQNGSQKNLIFGSTHHKDGISPLGKKNYYVGYSGQANQSYSKTFPWASDDKVGVCFEVEYQV